MPNYLIQAAYTSEAAAAFVSNPQDRVAGIKALTARLGGQILSFDFCLGEYDVIAIGTLPDDTAAAALSLSVDAAGHLRSYKTTRLMTPEEFQAAQQKAHATSYEAPTRA